MREMKINRNALSSSLRFSFTVSFLCFFFLLASNERLPILGSESVVEVVVGDRDIEIEIAIAIATCCDEIITPFSQFHL